MTTATVLVMAKAPVPGAVKTRLGATIGPEAAARLAHAALLDTLAVCESVFPPGRRVIALAGAPARSVEPAQLDRALSGWDVVAQEGATFAERLETAHRDAHVTHGGPVVQIGMDTPHLTARHLEQVVAATRSGRPVLGRAQDGGWWVLATTAPGDVTQLRRVPMSRHDTWARTRDCVERTAGTVLPTEELNDVDTAADAEVAAAAAPDTRFARGWRELLASGMGGTS
ncbi:TIGR04282 family arsenosugar biosynthesis glycosyltransferase [Pedococcus sp. 2YAF34]|uniref:TIGR04282 family arsenosugar biosynthesis glycosyltransferase n=1 Tax=Pedococcus sp. 2YAF34 TaxID=3233032 RepID=UPI003F9BA10C